MITATKNGITRNFSESHWKDMGKTKFGWVPVSETGETQTVNTDIIQKKMEAGVVIAEKVVPDEIIPARKIEQIPVIEKRKPGRQPRKS